MKKFICTALSAILILTVFPIIPANAAYDISVRMDAVTSYSTEYVEFGDIKPVQLESRTLVPARDMAEAAGMIVTWDQPTQTAILTLAVGLYSEKPIEQYAAKAISMVDPPMPNLTPVDITAALRLDSPTAVIRYNFRDDEGDYVAIGTEYEMVSKTILIDDGTLMLPLRDSMEMFGMNVGWNQDELCAYVSVPQTPSIPQGLRVISNPGEGEYAPTDENNEEYRSYWYEALLNGYDDYFYPDDEDEEDYSSGGNSDMQVGQYIGTFKITHYCPCNICNGSWGAGTAWAGTIIPGQTIAVDPNIITPLSWVYVDGYGYRRAEDCGSAIKEYHIDMAVPTHAMAMQMGVVYKDVYAAY